MNIRLRDRHDLLVMEVGKLPLPPGGERPQQTELPQYPSMTYPDHAVAMISNLPIG